MASGGRRRGGSADNEGPTTALVDVGKLAEAVNEKQRTLQSLEDDVITLAEATTALTSEIRMVDYARKEDKRSSRLLFGMLGVILALIAVGSFLQWDQAKANHDVANQIKSCTDPAGECYRDGQKRTGQAVDQLQQITIYAAACAVQHVDHPTTAVIRACVEENLREAGLTK